MIQTLSFIVTKLLRRKKLIQKFLKCEIQRYIDKIDLPNGELLIQVVPIPGPELEFHFQQSPWEALRTAVIKG